MLGTFQSVADIVFNLTATDDAGSAIDISSATIVAAITRGRSVWVPGGSMACAVVSGAAGTYTVTVDDTDIDLPSGKFNLEVKITVSGGAVRRFKDTFAFERAGTL